MKLALTILLATGLFLNGGSPGSPEKSSSDLNVTDGGMNNLKLEMVLESNGKIIEGRLGYWQLRYQDRVFTIITDERHNRMRIMTPVIESKKIKKAQYTELLEAQFDRVLDVKYALYNNYLWSVFIHPLNELTEEQVEDALSQVYYAAATFGTQYVSTNLQFGTRE